VIASSVVAMPMRVPSPNTRPMASRAIRYGVITAASASKCALQPLRLRVWVAAARCPKAALA